jgi:hypothetical protein
MPTFEPYQGSMWLVRRMCKLDSIKTDPIPVLLNLSAETNLRGENSDGATAVYELIHYTLSHRVLNVSKNIAERFMASKMNVELNHLRLPCSIFEVCFESDMKVPGTDIPMPSCMVIAKPDEACLGAISGFMEHVVKIQAKTLTVKPSVYVDPALKNAFLIKYRDPLTPKENIFAPMCHANLDLLKTVGKTVSEAIEELPLLQKAVRVTAMNEQDKMIQKNVMTVVLATLCYLNTNEPDLQPYKFKDRPKLGTIPPTATLIGGSFDRCPSGWHLRSAHFRTLANERFRRDETGKARVIWVRSAEVGKGAEPAGDKIKEKLVADEIQRPN